MVHATSTRGARQCCTTRNARYKRATGGPTGPTNAAIAARGRAGRGEAGKTADWRNPHARGGWTLLSGDA
eukprot:10457466-Lingulodinium_polyedra.AAC.1